MNRINLIPESRRRQRRRDHIRRTLRFVALCFTLCVVTWLACQRSGPAVSRAHPATGRVQHLQDSAVRAAAVLTS